ncbi:hypothetical protein NHQ30_003441 [Ciborinia camelliae]|nr:hypothetical protein NHQ30_003441 [Ciborinia camelliae]
MMKRTPHKEQWWAESGREISPEEEDMEMMSLAGKALRLSKQDAELFKEKEWFEKKAYTAKHYQKEAAEILREEHKDVKRPEANVRRDESVLRRQYTAFWAEKEEKH